MTPDGTPRTLRMVGLHMWWPYEENWETREDGDCLRESGDSVPGRARGTVGFPNCGNEISNSSLLSFVFEFFQLFHVVHLLLRLWKHLKDVSVWGVVSNNDKRQTGRACIYVSLNKTENSQGKNIIEKNTNFQRENSKSMLQKSSTQKYSVKYIVYFFSLF